MLIAGVMSGTSLDGIDVALVQVEGPRFKVVSFTSTPYSPQVRGAILAVSNAATQTAQISRLNFQLAELYARAIRRTARGAKLDLIGCHGQTVYHENGNTLQLGEASVIAERTGVPVISNFRARDIAAGGQGAPLVPFFDFRAFRHRSRRRVALNIGGIANVTLIPAAAQLDDVDAFDTGPGNMVMDQLVDIHTEGRLQFDRGGAIADSAEPDLALLDRLLANPYYRRKPPKSAGREQYGREFVEELRRTGLPLPRLIATAGLLTAVTIARAVGPQATDLIISGGGVHNRFVMGHLHSLLPNASIATTAAYGIDPDAKEAVAFALLARETWRRRPSNVPNATGARRAVILGEICYP